MNTLGLLFLLLASGLSDKGIYPEFDAGARMVPPPWPVVRTDSAVSVRVDPAHRVLTVYRGEAALVAYPLRGAPADQALPSLLEQLRPEDAKALRELLPPGPAPRVVVGAPPRAEDQDGDGIVDPLDILLGAKKLCLNKAAYHEAYRSLTYPGGDVPRTEGVCTDTLIRSLRNAGWDLQKEIHEDILRSPRQYSLEKKPDSNIDHRRVRNLVPWFSRNFARVAADEPMRPGDIVLLDTFPRKSGPDHAGVISDRLGPSGRPLVINNWTDGYVEQEMDLLHFVPVTHRFRPRSK